MSSSVEVGDRLRRERERLGLTQDEFAVGVGCSKTSQSNYERGERSPDALYLAAAASLGADVAYIVIGPKKEAALTADGRYPAYRSAPALTVEESALVDNYRHAGRDGRRAIEATSAALAKSERKAG